MTKQQVIDLCKKFLGGGGNLPPEIRTINDNRVIEKYLSLAFDTFFNKSSTIKDEIADEMGQSNWRYDQFVKRFYQPILQDSISDKYYSQLPAQIMSVNNNQGIRLISPAKEESTAFLPRKTLGTFLMDGLDVNTMNNIFYTLEGRNVYYSGDIDCNWENVLMKLAVKFEELDDEDWINIPDGDAAQIVQTAIGFMSGKMPSDIANDNTPTQNIK